MEIFSGQFILFELLGYKVSLIELTGTVTGLIAVWLAAKNNILTWPIGIVNVICFFFIFRESQLFSDMFLQVYFFLVCIYGWFYWRKKTDLKESKISGISAKNKMILVLGTIFSTAILGWMMSRVHIWFPSTFKQSAAFPYADTFVAVASVVANTLMARRKVESWIFWILIDVVATLIYYQKNLLLISAEFFIFTLMAVFGLLNWKRLMKSAAEK